jgi:hypothetical protein
MKWVGLGIFAAALAWMMWTPVPDVDDRPVPPGGGTPRVFELAYSSDPLTAGPHIAVLGLTLDDTPWDTLLLRFTTFDTTPDVRSLTIDAGGCIVARAVGPIANNQFAEFVRDRACRVQAAAPAEIRIAYNGRGRMAVWGAERSDPSQPAGPIVMVSGLDGPIAGAIPEARLRVRSGRPAVRRATLLAFVWQLRVRSLATVFIAIVVALGAGIALLPSQPRASMRTASFTIRSAAGAGLVAGAIAAAYGVTIPPLQAPDEPAHLLTYADLAGGTPLALDVRRLAERTHFSRLRFHPDEHFFPVHRDAPLHAEWDEHEAAVGQMDRRSPIGLLVWRAAPLVAPQFPAAHALLALRMVNAGAFALAAAAGVLIIALLTPLARPYMLIAPLLLAPAVPFFAAGVSNYALITCGAAVLAAGLLIYVLDVSPWASWPIAAGSVLLFATSHSTLSLLPLLAAVGAVRLALAGRDRERAAREAAIFWSSFALLPWAWLLLTTTRYHNEAFGLVAVRIPPDAAGALRWIEAHPAVWIAPGLAGGVLEWLRARSSRGPSALRPFATAFAVVTTATIALSVVLSLIVTLPTIPDLDVAPADRVTYVGRALATIVTSSRLAQFDALLQDTFWAALGWLDTPLPAWMEVIAVGLVAAFAIAGAIRIARVGNGRRAAAAAAIVSGMLLSAGLYAAASHSMGRNLHGRYLVPLYVPALVLALAPALRAPLRAGIGIAPLLAWHAYAIAVALNRYF